MRIDIGDASENLSRCYAELRDQFQWETLTREYISKNLAKELAKKFGIVKFYYDDVGKILHFFVNDHRRYNEITLCMVPIVLTSNPATKTPNLGDSIIPYEAIEKPLEELLIKAGCPFSYDLESNRILILCSNTEKMLGTLSNLFFYFVAC